MTTYGSQPKTDTQKTKLERAVDRLKARVPTQATLSLQQRARYSDAPKRAWHYLQIEKGEVI